MKNCVMQDSRGKKPEEEKGTAPSKRPTPQWCPMGITKTQKCRLQKMHQRELAEKKEKKERDYWFNLLRPMTKPKQTWREKWLAKEGGYGSGDSNGDEVTKVTPARGEDNPELRDGNLELGHCNPESGNCHPETGNHGPDSGNSNPGKENDRQGEEPAPMDINMVFTILVEFCASTKDVAE
jgi:hypothetical protein